jgi:hypothetical protein
MTREYRKKYWDKNNNKLSDPEYIELDYKYAILTNKFYDENAKCDSLYDIRKSLRNPQLQYAKDLCRSSKENYCKVGHSLCKDYKIKNSLRNWGGRLNDFNLLPIQKKYEEKQIMEDLKRLKFGKSTKRKSTKRKSTKRKSTKRKSTKRKSTKRKSTKRKSTKRKSTKRKSTKRKSTKRKSTKRKSTKRKSTKRKCFI